MTVLDIEQPPQREASQPIGLCLSCGYALRGLPTPRPLAVLHRRHFGLLQEGYLLVETVADAADLHTAANCLANLTATERRLQLRYRIEQIARLVRELHRRHVSHRDLKAMNILIAPVATGTISAHGRGRQRQREA